MNKKNNSYIALESFVQNIPCFIFLLDKEGRIIEVIGRIEDFELKIEDIIGKNIFNLSFLNSEEIDNLFNFKGEFVKLELKLGKEEKKYAIAKLIELKEEYPKYMIIFHDITEEELLKIKLKEDEEIISELQALIEKSIAGIYMYDENFKFIYVNSTACDIVGYSKNELIGKNVSEIVYEEDINLVKELAKKRFLGEIESAGFNLRLKRFDGQIRYCYVSGKVGRYKGKKVILGTGIDITERIKLENEIKQDAKLIEETLNGTIHALSKIVEIRDPYTAGHQLSVSILAEKIAREIGFKEEEIKEIVWAGLLHDIGKISIPSELLVVPRKLTSIEFSIVKTHPIIAYNIIKVIPQFEKISQIVLQHHERLDGTGYPRGIKGDEIIKEAKIIAVCDVVDAMISHRPYRPALTIDEAINEIYINKGIKYDEEVVNMCIDLIKKGFSF
ncbi:MAG: PAS domain S-box protein, partial [Candidatus Omnitrophica bacterium]|nr:PAS domain S-box protein [Candidatus Omnitrophota bacterium]